MVFFNVTVEDTSPLITYNGEWVWTDQDPLYTSYSQASSHGTNKIGDNATFTFRGSAVYLYGAKRDNHGSFRVDLDNHSVMVDGYAPTNSMLFQTVLFSETSLDEDDEHTLTIINTGSGMKNMSWVDVDFIVFTATDGRKRETVLKSSRVDDSDPGWRWSGDWKTDEGNSFGFLNTQHRTWAPGASVSIPFEGDGVGVHGSATNISGPFSVSIDNEDTIVLDAHAPKFINDSLLYFTSRLKPGPHTLTLTHIGFDNDTCFDVDYIEVLRYTPAPFSKREIGAIVAAIVLALFFLLLIPLGVFICQRRRRRYKRRAQRTAQPYTQLRASGSTFDDGVIRLDTSRHVLYGTPQAGPRDLSSPLEHYSPVTYARTGSVIDPDFGSLIRTPHPDRTRNHALQLSTVLSNGQNRILSVHERDDSTEPLLTGGQSTPLVNDTRRRPAGATLMVEEDQPPVYTSPRASFTAKNSRKR